jgi:hypothetical protein
MRTLYQEKTMNANKNFKATKTCTNCRWCKVVGEQDCKDKYYCSLGKNPKDNPPDLFTTDEEIEQLGWGGRETDTDCVCDTWAPQPMRTAWLDWEGRGYDNLLNDITLCLNAIGPDAQIIYHDTGILFYDTISDKPAHFYVRNNNIKDMDWNEETFLSILTSIRTTPRQKSISFRVWLDPRYRNITDKERTKILPKIIHDTTSTDDATWMETKMNQLGR